MPDQVAIFGASGDLTRRKLIPALTRLDADPRPPVGFSVLGVARRPMSDDAFRDSLAVELPAELRDAFRALAPRIFYAQGDASDPASLQGVAKRLDALPGGSDANRLFYLSLKPELFPVAGRELANAGLLEERGAYRRLVIEKPFGTDLETAQALNRQLHWIAHEEQIYRIDHYLGKDTVQNLLGFRFHNSIFEPLWNRHHVELVQITAAETIGVERGRGGYYDTTGAVRDMVQNHLLQVLSLVAMETPASIEGDAVRGQKVGVLRALRHPPNDERTPSVVRGRYGPGVVEGQEVRGYTQEEGVAEDSMTETFVALRCGIDNWRWAGVPFLLRHGKRLKERFTQIQVQFRKPPIPLFNRPKDLAQDEYLRMVRDGSITQMRPNVLTLRIQPQESIQLSFGVKRPGNTMDMAPAKLSFDYQEQFGHAPANAYERLLADAMLGDPTLFLRGDEIEASWRYADAVLESFQGKRAPLLHEYAAGTWGPEEADGLFGEVEASWSRG